MFQRLVMYAVVCVAGFGCGTRPDLQTVDVTFQQDDDDTSRIVVVVELPASAAVEPLSEEQLARLLVLHRLDESDNVGSVPVLGKYHVSGHTLTFRPAFSLVPGESYRAMLDLSVLPNQNIESASADFVIADYSLPAEPAAPAPEIDAIYSSAKVLPANHLKFYLVFSEPMQQADIFRHFTLKDLTTGEFVGRPFRHTQLWSRDELRLTLWFHPGRQKTGLNLNVELGPVLQEGHEYELGIAGEWLSQRGTTLGTQTVKRFRAGPADRTQPDPQAWTLAIPPARSKDPLTVRFTEPLDWALLRSELNVLDAQGTQVAGSVAVGEDEQIWHLTPASSWEPGEYRVAVNGQLEDLAGNAVDRPFEVDLEAAKPRSEGLPGPFIREFTIAAP
ncbi:MAG: hypothetical protein CMJ48_09020 [Planctomycetaceae bacterium]|nr:hypothetical protein [Planctomycetaceae bacterium]